LAAGQLNNKPPNQGWPSYFTFLKSCKTEIESALH